MAEIELYLGDCLDVLPGLSGPFDAIIADLPYGTTACKWDTVIPFAPLWEQYKRLIKPRGAIVLFGSQPFTSALVMSNLEWFKYAWVWHKNNSAGFATVNYRPFMVTEDICVFSKNGHAYYPQIETRGKPRLKGGYSKSECYGLTPSKSKSKSNTYYPKNLLQQFGNAKQSGKVHPTQKPVALLEYLIRTYTNEGETVLDNCFGSCTTGIACLNTGRNFVGIEKEPEYFKIGQERIRQRQLELGQIHPSYDMTDTCKSSSQEHLPPVQIEMFGTVLCGEQG